MVKILKKPSNVLFFFKRLKKKVGSGDEGGDTGSAGGSSRWKFKSSTGLRWKKKRFSLHNWFVDGLLFKIMSVFEAIVLVATVALFFLCCGCQF